MTILRWFFHGIALTISVGIVHCGEDNPCYIPYSAITRIQASSHPASTGYRYISLQSGYPFILGASEASGEPKPGTSATMNIRDGDILLAVDSCSLYRVAIRDQRKVHKAYFILDAPELLNYAKVKKITIQRNGKVYELHAPTFEKLSASAFSEPIQVHKSQHWSALDGTWVQIFPEDERKAWRLYFDQGIYSLHLSNLSKQREVLIPDVKVDCYPHRKCRIWASQRYQFTVQYSEEKVKIIRPLVYDSSLAMKANELYRRKPDR